jgi:hypothetical protein
MRLATKFIMAAQTLTENPNRIRDFSVQYAIYLVLSCWHCNPFQHYTACGEQVYQ